MSVQVSALTITQAASAATAAPGAVVGYTVTVTNSGLVAYSGATFTDPLAGVLDDAAYNGNAAATSGSVSYHQPEPDLDRQPGGGRHRHHHLLRHRQ